MLQVFYLNVLKVNLREAHVAASASSLVAMSPWVTMIAC
jgi:hypothetical protein